MTGGNMIIAGFIILEWRHFYICHYLWVNNNTYITVPSITVGVKIICPLSQVNFNIVKKISDYAPNIKVLNGNNSLYGMFIVDSRKFLKAELRIPDAEELSEAIGFAIYSNSKVLSSILK